MLERILRQNIILLFIEWQFFEKPKNILRAWRNFLKFNLEYFSIPILIKTLFYPWHRYRMSYRGRFEPGRYFETFVFNTMSRWIGAFLRIFFIFSGILAEVLILFAGAVVFVGWFALPALLILAALFGFWLLSFDSTFALVLLSLTILVAFWYAKGFFKTTLKKPGKVDLTFVFSRALLNLAGTPFQDIKDKDSLINLAREDPTFQKILVANNLKAADIENLVEWRGQLQEKIEERKKFWEEKNLRKLGSLAKQWTAGYTITLDKFSIDLNEEVKRRGFPEVIGHQKEIEQMERILARSEINNVLIVGEPGSGRRSMVYDLTKKAALGESLTEINYKRVLQLDLPSLLAQTGGAEEAETILDTIFKETILAGNIILVIDDFHNFVGGVMRPGAINISGVIAKYLYLPEFQIVAITTFEGLHESIEQNASLVNLFEKVEVSEVSEKETLTLLEKLTLVLEYKHRKLFISYPALSSIITLSAKYLPSVPFPEKAMDLLDEVVVHVLQIKDKVVRPEHVARVVRDKTQIPVGEIEAKEREVLLNLEAAIHKRIVNQEEAVKEVSTALRRARTEVTVRKGPMGAFLFLGPTGVGKTETSKALAEIYFGSEERMIRLDMSEFQNVGDIPRLIGAVGQEGLLTTPVRESPFSLILLDELEKAHPNVLNLFLQVFDEGHLTDGSGRKVDFKNAIIIATSNAGYQVILEALKQNMEWSGVKSKMLDHLFAEGVFRPEFINRFDAMVIFKPLSKENLLEIAELLLRKLKKNLLEKGIDLIITEPLKEKIVELGYNPVFGAREMRRVIQDKVENVLASAILSRRLTRGSRVQIDSGTFQLKINP